MFTIDVLKRDYLLPAAIILAGLILAVAVYVIRTNVNPALVEGNPTAVLPVTPVDHLMGNPTAPIVIIEYADIDSEHSKEFQTTMEQIMADYAAGGKVAWVYRHFPLLDQNVDSGSHAEAAECAAYLGNEGAFWRFIDTLQSAATGENHFPREGYPAVAIQLGIPQSEFMQCLSSGRFSKKVYEESTNALAAGATGAPYIIILAQGQEVRAVNGAISYESMRQIIDDAISKLPATD